jgi:succinate dehydrogenase hydrophobic anchor subunit
LAADPVVIWIAQRATALLVLLVVLFFVVLWFCFAATFGVFEAIAFAACFEDMATMGEPI